jgi:hypothetical protein
VRLYVETNFVVELSTTQPGSRACWAIVDAGATSELDLVIPAFSLVEPYWTFEARRRERADLQRRAETEVGQLARSENLATQAESLARSLPLLTSASEEHRLGFDRARNSLRNTARVVQLDARVLELSERYATVFGLSAFDAIVAASVVDDLSANPLDGVIFVTQDAKDFGDPDLLSEFRGAGCEVVYSFGEARSRIGADR